MRLSRRSPAAPVVTENPFVLPKEDKEEEEHLLSDEILGDKVSFTNAHPAPATTAKLFPVAGGVGVSTLITVSDNQLSELDTDDSQSPVILVATTAADRLATTRRLLKARVTEQGHQIVGLVLVHDRPKLSKATVAETKTVMRMAERAWVIPWLPYLREPAEPPAKHPLRVRKAIAEIIKTTH